MEDRFLILYLDSDGCGQIVALYLGLSIFKRRGHGVNVCAHRLPGVIFSEQAIPLGKEILKRADRESPPNDEWGQGPGSAR